MEKRTFRIVAIAAAAVLVGTVGVAVIATADGSAGVTAGLLAHLHGGDHRHDHMAELIEELNLTADQRERMERVHEIMASHRDGPGAMLELHNQLMAQFEQGQVDTRELRRVIDSNVEQMREMLYAVTDEAVALINGLDATQREIVMQHIQAAKEKGRGHGR